MARKPFIVYKRSAGKKKPSYYIAFWDSTLQKYANRRSVADLIEDLGNKAAQLSPTTRAGAEAAGRLVLEAGLPAKGAVEFGPYLEQFWLPEGLHARGKKTRKKELSAEYLQNSQLAVNAHIIPYLKEHKLYAAHVEQITPAHLEGLILHLDDKLNTGRRVNGVFQTVRVPLSSYWRGKGHPERNPAMQIEKLPESPKQREILTRDEARRFFELPWTDDRHRAINLLAASTGLRLGELRGLLRSGIHCENGEYRIRVRTNWQDGEGLKDPKHRKFRDVPLPPQMGKILEELIAQNPFGEDEQFVFWGSKPGLPIAKRTVEAEYNRRICEVIGGEDPDKARKVRGLTFHSWRHFFDSLLEGKLSAEARRRVVGHSSKKMDDRYLHVTAEQLTAITNITGGLLL